MLTNYHLTRLRKHALHGPKPKHQRPTRLSLLPRTKKTKARNKFNKNARSFADRLAEPLKMAQPRRSFRNKKRRKTSDLCPLDDQGVLVRSKKARENMGFSRNTQKARHQRCRAGVIENFYSSSSSSSALQTQKVRRAHAIHLRQRELQN